MLRTLRVVLLLSVALGARAVADEPANQSPSSEIDKLAAEAAQAATAADHQQAIALYDRLLTIAPKRAEYYDLRGSQHFMLGHIDESIADFDRFLALRPDQEPWHWKRGISYYYAGSYDDGRRQFEGYQTVDDSDVENAVWRFVCMARGQGVPAARAGLLKIKHDRRVPMMEVYALYAGKLTPDDVLKAAQAGSPSPEELNSRLFYAHLYLGLYYEATGDAANARKHIDHAARQHKIGHYMWNVADVHAKRLQAKPDR